MEWLLPLIIIVAIVTFILLYLNPQKDTENTRDGLKAIGLNWHRSHRWDPSGWGVNHWWGGGFRGGSQVYHRVFGGGGGCVIAVSVPVFLLAVIAYLIMEGQYIIPILIVVAIIITAVIWYNYVKSVGFKDAERTGYGRSWWHGGCSGGCGGGGCGGGGCGGCGG